MSGFNALTLPNVRLSQKLLERWPTHTYFLNRGTSYGEVMNTVITKNPNWDFELVGGEVRGENTYEIRNIKVYAGKEWLGTVSYEYHGSERKIHIANARIASERVRNQGKAVTADPKRALSLINKAFYRKTPVELMAQARGEASNLLYRINSDIAMRFTQRRNNFNESAGEFVMAMQLGLASVMSAYSKGDDLMGKIAECSRLSVELSDVRNLCNLNSADSTTTVVVMPVGYVVHSGDTLSTHTDETLPEDLKGPLGMLKLTEAGTVLPMGIRINDTVFVIRTEGESDVA
jgi:hypothetical protein